MNRKSFLLRLIAGIATGVGIYNLPESPVAAMTPDPSLDQKPDVSINWPALEVRSGMVLYDTDTHDFIVPTVGYAAQKNDLLLDGNGNYWYCTKDSIPLAGGTHNSTFQRVTNDYNLISNFSLKEGDMLTPQYSGRFEKSAEQERNIKILTRHRVNLIATRIEK